MDVIFNNWSYFKIEEIYSYMKLTAREGRNTEKFLKIQNQTTTKIPVIADLSISRLLFF